MPSPHAHVAVVGGGPAAATLVRELHRGGAEGVHLFSAEDRPPYDRTTVSKALLDGSADDAPPLFPDVLGASDGPAVHLGSTVAQIDRADRSLTCTDGTHVTWDRLVLATGAAPWVPPIDGLDRPEAQLLRTAREGHRLRTHLDAGRRLIVVGGGVIGLEVAAAARARGAEVVVLEVTARPMARVLPAPVVDPLLALHRDAGVDVRTAVLPRATEVDGDTVVVACADGTFVHGDHVLVATGVRPRTDLAEAAGLAVDDGVVVDPLLTTDDPSIMAIGDVARVVDPDAGTSTRTEAYTPAMAMGQHAARTILGEPTPYRDVPWSWSDQYDCTVQATGWPDLATSWIVRGTAADLEAGLVAFGRDDDGRVRAAAGISRGRAVGRVVRGAQKLITAGAHVEPDVLADPTVDLRRLARDAR